ncbi:MAG: hypothetical protein OXC63_05600 [Aestuariivita sp.]|nr:hypothetical protein [Aestuariivita sp.]
MIRIPVRNQNGGYLIPTIIDTGFDGFVQISLQLAHALGWLGQTLKVSNSMVADGQTINVALFES